MKPLLTLTLALLLGTLSPSLALDCATSPDRTSGPGWRYRVIDSRQCWYRNEIALPKSDLSWPESHSLAPKIQDQHEAYAPLTPVLVRTVSYRETVRDGGAIDRHAVARVIMGVGFLIVIAGMVGVGVRRENTHNGVNK